MNPSPPVEDAPTTAGHRPAADPGPRRLHQISTLCRTANYARRHLEHTVLRQARLTWTSYDVLHLSVMHRPIDTGVLAALVGVSKGTVTRAAATLIRRGLLQRTTPEQDLRRSQLTPTAAGWELNHDLRQRLIAELTRLVDTPSPRADVANLRRLLHPGDEASAVPTQDTPGPGEPSETAEPDP